MANNNTIGNNLPDNNFDNLELDYTILCDDVRLEAGNKLSLMGVFQNIMVPQLPLTLIKFAIVSHWHGIGRYNAEVRVMSADKRQIIVASQPTNFEVGQGGFADNVSFFVNVVFPQAGTYWVQTLVNSSLYDEFPMMVVEADNADTAAAMMMMGSGGTAGSGGGSSSSNGGEETVN